MDLATGGEAAKIVAPFKSDLIKLLKGVKDEWVNMFEEGVSQFIDDRKKKISYTNTFISTHTKVEFIKTYFPLTISNWKETKK